MNIRRRRPDTLTDPNRVLDAMGRCRDVLIRESSTIKPFGETYVEIQCVTKAIDRLAKHLTGAEEFYWADGSSGESGRKRWRDSGTR